MSEFKVILTNAGVAAFAQATSTSTTVDFSNFAVGDSNGSYYAPTPDLTTLKNERWRGDVLDVKQVPGTSKIEVTTVIPATVGGWYIREMAIFSADGTILAIGKVPESFKPDPLSGSSKDLSIKAVFEVSNASVVNIVIDPNNVIANKKYVDDKVSDLEQRAGTAIGVVDERVAQHLVKMATTTDVGHVKLNDSTTSTSITEAATANAVKKVKDIADSKLPQTNPIANRLTVQSTAPYVALDELQDGQIVKTFDIVVDDSAFSIRRGLTEFIDQYPLYFGTDSILKTVGQTIYHTGNTGGFYRGTGSPEGVITAPVGALYQRLDGGANTTLYVKQSGTGNTGWFAK